MPSLSTLLTLLTPAQAEALIVAFLQNPGNGLPPLPATAWAATSVPVYFLKSEAQLISLLSQNIVDVGAGGFFQLAAAPALRETSGPNAGTSPWVTLGAREFFNRERATATPAIGLVTLTASANAPANTTIQSGRVTITDTQGNRFANVAQPDATTSGTLARSSTITLTFTAQTPGSDGNLAFGTPVALVTALPGVTAALGAPAASSWLTTSGADLQSDESLIAQCLNQWTALGTGSPQGAWENWCFAASSEVRYAIAKATGLGTVQVTVWGDGADVSEDGLAAVEAFVEARMPLGSSLAPGSPVNAVALELTMAATLYGPASAQAASIEAAETALRNLVLATPIGGNPIGPGTPETFGISNSDLATAITNASLPITKVTVAVNNGSGLVDGDDFLMPTSAGVPVVAQVPAGSNPFSLQWIST